MRKRISTMLAVHLLFACIASAQVYQGQIDSSLLPLLSPHYQAEYTFDKSTHETRWNSQKGFHAGFGSTDALYFRTEVPELQKESQIWYAAGWKGERLNAQILIWSADTLEQVRFKVSNLVNVKGNVISTDNIKLNMVRYVLANYPYGASDVTCGDSPYKNGFLMPDRFEAFDRFDVPGKTVRPVWVTLNIPPGTQAGYYKGTIDVLAKGHRARLDVNINVQNQLLPPPHDWKYRLDLWQNPWVVAWDNHLKPWSPEHKALLKKHLQLYADAGGKYITTYAVHSPWADNSYMIEGGMIEWIKKAGGGWRF